MEISEVIWRIILIWLLLSIKSHIKLLSESINVHFNDHADSLEKKIKLLEYEKETILADISSTINWISDELEKIKSFMVEDHLNKEPDYEDPPNYIDPEILKRIEKRKSSDL